MHVSWTDLVGEDIPVPPDFAKVAEHGEHLMLVLPSGHALMITSAADFASIQETLAIAADPEITEAIRSGLADISDGRTMGTDELRRVVESSRQDT